MAKPFRMNWGSKNQDSLGAQIEEVENAKFESEIMNRNEFAEVFGESEKPKSNAENNEEKDKWTN